MRLVSWVGACAMIACSGCTTAPAARRDGGSLDAGPIMDAGRDAGRCAADIDCNDGFTCTLDSCGVGGVCRNQPFDEMCMMGERCVVGRGCTMGMPETCTTAVDCDDGDYCNGVEECLGPAGSRVCIAGMPVDCNDGNDCTIDTCDEATAGCRYSLAPGCDAGTAFFDGGTPCDAFEDADYAGTFTFRPAAVSACTGTAIYNINEISISIAGAGLSVRADRFTLAQAARRADGMFDVTLSDGCGTYRLQGAFSCANRWSGMWTASFSGSCGGCPGQSMSVRGSRR